MRRAVKLGVFLLGALAAHRYLRRGHLTDADLADCVVQAAQLLPLAFAVICCLRRRRPKGLDTVLFHWPDGSPYTIRHLLEGLAIFGAVGQGKTLTSGRHMASAVVGIPNSSGVIFSSNPGDAAWWRARFREAGREGDLKVFSPTGTLRWNILATMQTGKWPADARSLTRFFINIAETISDSKGGQNEEFWKQLQERIIYNAVEAIRQGRGSVDAPSLARFIAGAAFDNSQLRDERWIAGYHNETLMLARRKQGKTAVEAADFTLLAEFWIGEYPVMDQKVKSSAIAGISNVLHSLNAGIVRQMISTTTNASADDLARGEWHLWDLPVTEYGPSAKALYSAVKAAVQAWVLKRDFNPGDPVVVLWGDEAWHIANSGDLEYMAESRKHGGTIIYLTQSVNQYAIALSDGADRRKSQALLGLFSHKIIHACDYSTAEFGSKLVGQAMQVTINSSPREPGDPLRRLLGGEWNHSIQQGMRQLITEREFMTGLDIGQAWVIRTGASFNSNYGNAIRVTFQRG